MIKLFEKYSYHLLWVILFILFYEFIFQAYLDWEKFRLWCDFNQEICAGSLTETTF